MIDVNSLPPWQLLLIIPVIAFLYASVGFGGASGYLAVISMSVKMMTMNSFLNWHAYLEPLHKVKFQVAPWVSMF